METLVISLGGSIIVPDSINTEFLIQFREIILTLIKTQKVAIITGGGAVARNYGKAAKEITTVSDIDVDEIGIRATKINAELIRSIFSDIAYEKVVESYDVKEIKTDKKIIIGSGWKPGCSSDLDAVLLAEILGANTIVNLSNIEYVYDKDPKKFKDAKKYDKMTFKQLQGVVGERWVPGANVPFDPIATKKASKLGMTIVVMSNNLDNFKDFCKGKDFKGTVIE